MKNAIVKEEYLIAIKSKANGNYIFTAHPCKADTLEKCKAQYPEYRKNWERCSSSLDFDDYEIRHRTVITTDWEVVESTETKLMPMPGTTDPDWGKKHWGKED
jgi:hypothetical protein